MNNLKMYDDFSNSHNVYEDNFQGGGHDSMGRGTGTFLDVYNVNAGTITDVVERKNEIKINKFNSSKTYPDF